MADYNPTPWYRRVRRWGQTNLTEIDPLDYDHAFWRAHWRRTRVQGLVVNAGGIVAYYPSRIAMQYRAEHLGGRDLFGEITTAAREDGLAVLARMDSNRATEEFYRAHPDWFAVNEKGEPCRTGDRYQACVNSPYYKEFLPEVLREIIDRYHPDGFTDNSWTGLGRKYICRCEHCRRKFRDEAGLDLPAAPDWGDPVYRRWIRWSYQCRLDNWDLNNRVTREHGGPDCLWLGMVHADPVSSHVSFCDLKAVGERSVLMMCDQQSRTQATGFEQNGLTGKILHGVAGWDAIIPESMAMYVRGDQAFRRASAPPAEARTWMVAGFAGGISPWWHHVGARQEDARQFDTAEPVMRWHEANEPYLYGREPVANVGLVWSHDNVEFFGRDDAKTRVQLPWRGFTMALTRARIPFLPVHADHIDRDAARLDTLILPEVAALSGAQCAAIRGFVERGGGLVVTGRTGQLDEDGEARKDFPLADILGVRPTGRVLGIEGQPQTDWEIHTGHNYLRLMPDAGCEGNQETSAARHPILAGFDRTDILPLGATLQVIEPLAGADVDVIATYVPSFPIYPPEFSWMRQPRSETPAIIAREQGPQRGRVVYFAADVDRRHARQGLPDHGDLLANAIRWAARDRQPLRVEGPGYLDCHVYRQGGRFIVHIVNLSGANQWPGYREEYLPVGPIRVSLAAPEGLGASTVRLTVAGIDVKAFRSDGRIEFEVPNIADHEMVII